MYNKKYDDVVTIFLDDMMYQESISHSLHKTIFEVFLTNNVIVHNRGLYCHLL